tara:strand:- start:29578 stop:29985 length:408 start_codon:yes stop_codon:yes gene_type:complete
MIYTTFPSVFSTDTIKLERIDADSGHDGVTITITHKTDKGETDEHALNCFAPIDGHIAIRHKVDGTVPNKVRVKSEDWVCLTSELADLALSYKCHNRFKKQNNGVGYTDEAQKYFHDLLEEVETMLNHAGVHKGE